MNDKDQESVALVTRPDIQTSYSKEGSVPQGNKSPVDHEASSEDEFEAPMRRISSGQVDDPAFSPNGPNKPHGDEPDNGWNDTLSKVHEEALLAVGFGKLQLLLVVIVGLGLMGDMVELIVMAYIIPGAEVDFCMDGPMKGWLGAIAFAGMMVGAFIWGNLADKIGRRRTLLTALIINLIFSFIAAFMPLYWMFLVCRFCAGVGIGGSIPICFAYFVEFCQCDHRGRYLGVLLLFWVSGGVYVSALGWIIIPVTDISVAIGGESGFHFHSWRVFLLVCILPVLLSVIGLVFMPESPRFLLQVGQDLEALAIYRRIFSINHTGEPGSEYEMPEIEVPIGSAVRVTSNINQETCLQSFVSGLENFWNSVFQLFFPPYSLRTFLMCVIWFSLGFGYYGITIWFPEYIKVLEREKYYAQTVNFKNTSYSDQIYTGQLDNLKFTDVNFDNVTFQNIRLTNVNFENCIFNESRFLGVVSRSTYFTRTTIINTDLNNTDFYPFKFRDSRLKDSFIINLKPGCQKVDFGATISARNMYLENFFGQLVIVPGVLFTTFLLDKFGRVKVQAVELFLSGIMVFFIWATNTELSVVILNCFFNFTVIGVWCTLDCLSVELYPTHLRSTAFGLQSSLGRIAALMGNVMFGNFIEVSKAIPILITAVLMAVAGSATMNLPESKELLL